MIRIGSAGWSYPDFEGIVYPSPLPKGFDGLAFLAGFLDTIEINSSFYRIPSEKMAASWAERVSDRPSFLFTAKLWRGFTHEAPSSASEAGSAGKAFLDAMRPLREAGLLGAVLLQFPYAFHNTAESRARLSELLDRFEGLPLAVEMRHTSWLREEFFGYLKERGAAFCNIDQPAISSNILPTARVTSDFAYVRLHGRNRDAWFEEGAGRDRRYDYLYSSEDLGQWAARVTGMAAGTKDVFVVANNHYRGQGVANAVEMKSILDGKEAEAPATLIKAYPHLAGRARALPSKPPRTSGPVQGILPL